VPNENFRRELGHVFDEMAGSASPALPDRVRSSLAAAPERRGPFWIAGLAAALIAAIAVSLLVVANLNRNQTSVVPGSHPTASPAPTSSLPPFTCTSFTYSGLVSGPPALIDRVQTGTHQGYDRLTIEFKDTGPGGIEIRPQAGTQFTLGASGQTVTLGGKSGILVVIQGADLHTDYSGATDITTGYPILIEVRQVEDFEGVVQLALGVSGLGCYRTFLLTNPTRLVVDVQAT
jgi:hypothetical protein